ncbi:Leu/Phe/Val dehydrogenase [Paraferrimonas sedimenticola]|uniref:Leucine dehydrogenase n=1 Tax=Paraferrimonas sedimenticola TaxID=375674 RepID=A0AA37W2N3_9GAMM|nr:Glu/Leu/Phe/Val dehydrogenase [Paraferrimonas sedimenticola]GLP97858.1 leucine dehydrogenase [Paraferrimonas sedimenticola]
MTVFNHVSFDNHEQLVFCQDPETGLRAIIAVHDTTLGPAVGGCRMWNYESDEEAINDVLRLSRGMTYKNALAGLDFGGGKSVIMADPRTKDREALFRAFGRAVHKLGGSYYSAEDVGVTTKDIMIAHQETPYMAGLEGKSGDPSPFTAYGTYMGIKAAVEHHLGHKDLKGLKVSVQGVGHVGYYLCRHLHEAGAELIVTDINTESLDRVATEFGAKVVGLDEIYAQDVDVYAPCALGATINDTTIPQIKAKVIAGCANNQLAEKRHDEVLKNLGILYAPDYVINAGGIINVYFERDYCADKSKAKVAEIYNTLTKIFDQAKAENRPTGEVADEMARSIIADARANG